MLLKELKISNAYANVDKVDLYWSAFKERICLDEFSDAELDELIVDEFSFEDGTLVVSLIKPDVNETEHHEEDAVVAPVDTDKAQRPPLNAKQDVVRFYKNKPYCVGYILWCINTIPVGELLRFGEYLHYLKPIIQNYHNRRHKGYKNEKGLREILYHKCERISPLFHWLLFSKLFRRDWFCDYIATLEKDERNILINHLFPSKEQKKMIFNRLKTRNKKIAAERYHEEYHRKKAEKANTLNELFAKKGLDPISASDLFSRVAHRSFRDGLDTFQCPCCDHTATITRKDKEGAYVAECAFCGCKTTRGK